MLLSKTQIFLMRCLVLGLAMAFPSCMAAQSLDRGDSEKTVPKTGKKWKLTGMGEMKTHDGSELDFVAYQNQDGASVTIIRGNFDSDKQSASELHDVIKNAKKVIEQSFRKDESGKIVGERVVAVLIQTDPAADLQAVLWTEGPKYYEIVSDSLSLALECEKKLSQPAQKTKEHTVSEYLNAPVLTTPGGI
jgi:hypothetical protein